MAPGTSGRRHGLRAARQQRHLRDRLTWLDPGQLAERIRYERWKRLSFLEDLEFTESLQRGLACLRLEALAVEAGTVPDAVFAIVKLLPKDSGGPILLVVEGDIPYHTEPTMTDVSDMNLAKLIQHYSEEANCRELLKEIRWPNGVECPRCSHGEVYEIRKRNQYQCKECEYRFSVTAGTIFDNTNLPLWKWFVAIYLILESKKGVSAAQIARTIDVSYPTAWHLCHRIREALDEDDDGDGPPPLLSGIVEVGETWVGGDQKGVGRGSMEHKTMVAGAVQRDGDTRMDVVSGRDRKRLHGFIERHVSGDTEAIFTDEWAAYRGIEDEDTRHETVNHSADEWVRGEVHTNGVEGLWSLLHRLLVGAFHKVTVKHLERYLDELAWRFSNRDNENIFRDTLAKMVTNRPLRLRTLTA